MWTLLSCLEKFNKDQSMCVDEINKFDRCFVMFRQKQAEAKALKEKGVIPTGQYAKLSGDQMTSYFKKFPLSGRNKQTYWYPEFRPKYSHEK